jgi:hypothetical protein
MIYVYSFSPRTELIGFINFFVVNVIACFLDMVLAFIALFSQGQGQSTTTIRVSKLTSITTNIRWVVEVIFPCVNFKRALFNIRLKSSSDCVTAVNTLMLTNYSVNVPWMSLTEPGVGAQFVIFCAQMGFWWTILTLVEQGTRIKRSCRQCCGCNNDLEQMEDQGYDEDGTPRIVPKAWDDSVCYSNLIFSE